jgi:hypothetical protein
MESLWSLVKAGSIHGLICEIEPRRVPDEGYVAFARALVNQIESTYVVMRECDPDPQVALFKAVYRLACIELNDELGPYFLFPEMRQAVLDEDRPDFRPPRFLRVKDSTDEMHVDVITDREDVDIEWFSLGGYTPDVRLMKYDDPRYFTYSRGILIDIEQGRLAQSIGMISSALRAGKRVVVCSNGIDVREYLGSDDDDVMIFSDFETACHEAAYEAIIRR